MGLAQPLRSPRFAVAEFYCVRFLQSWQSALETLAGDGRLAAYVDEYKSIAATNGGQIVAKCAFQKVSKSQQVARKLEDIADQITEKMHDFSEEMAAGMRRS
jgi:Skp family chaperone for outer membrane proteins